MLAQWFTPEPVFKGLLFVKELSKLGHDIQVLTGFPNYPGGKLYNEYPRPCTACPFVCINFMLDQTCNAV